MPSSIRGRKPKSKRLGRAIRTEARSLNFAVQRLGDHFRDQAVHRSTEARHLAHQPARDVGVRFAGNEERPSRVRSSRRRFIIAICISYSRSVTARIPRRMIVAPRHPRVVHEQAVEAADLDVIPLRHCASLQEFDAFAECEHRLFLVVAQHAEDHPVEVAATPLGTGPGDRW